ncbi:hypothetical protein OIE87_53315 [Streptomyces mirabilis]|nr:hypothetical protein [Streptomyces mirabilis]
MAPLSASTGSRVCVRKYTPLRCTSTRSSKSFSVVSANGAVRSVPALLTRKSNVVLPQRAWSSVPSCSAKSAKVFTTLVSSRSATEERP